ncbi:uncharacterized protein LOC141611716 [Silene latifolia]|uniref:uncharacterized protein LOC141611716 n=1 Tax=Silene latifolia TaxID=37657 RepID=UPI003D781303
MASIALRHKSHHLNLKSHHTLFNFSRLYSSASSNNDNGDNQPPKPSPFSSYFSQINPKSGQQQQSSSSSQFDEIRKNLSEFRIRSSPNNLRPTPTPSFSKGNSISFDRIRESLQKLRDKKPDDRRNNAVNQPFSSDNFTQNTNTNTNTNTSRVIGGGSFNNLPSGSFGKEIKEKQGVKKSDENDPARFNLIKVYTHAELGKALKELRPDVSTLSKNKKKEGEEGLFTLSELQQRLAKLKEIEEEEERKKSDKGPGGVQMGELRKSLVTMRLYSSDEKKSAQKSDILSPGFMISTPGVPQEQLIEKYFHPDNMSAAEKLKLELKKVRDEFKMSETDCGSARVQIAQLTTEIHHLSSVLHKKDKHSLRGLHGKVQKRKKLLKYLRRTDWDSYCFVLTKLGLRDNPVYKTDYNKN